MQFLCSIPRFFGQAALALGPSIHRLVLATLAALALSSSAQALDLKGLEIGKPVDCERMKAAGTVVGGQCESPETTAGWQTTLAGHPTLVMFNVEHGKLTRALSNDFDFDAVRSALVQRWGEPECAEAPMMNGHGAKFMRTLCTWTADGATLAIGQNVQRWGDRFLQFSRDRSAEAARAAASAASDI
jgi:hypothetical protein